MHLCPTKTRWENNPFRFFNFLVGGLATDLWYTNSGKDRRDRLHGTQLNSHRMIIESLK